MAVLLIGLKDLPVNTRRGLEQWVHVEHCVSAAVLPNRHRHASLTILSRNNRRHVPPPRSPYLWLGGGLFSVNKVEVEVERCSVNKEEVAPPPFLTDTTRTSRDLRSAKSRSSHIVPVIFVKETSLLTRGGSDVISPLFSLSYRPGRH